MGGLEVLLDRLQAGTQEHAMAHVAYHAARRGAYLTHSLRAYSGKQVLRPAAVGRPGRESSS